MDNYKLIHGDASEVLKSLHGQSIDACITSPPYWNEGLSRSGSLGREAKVADYANRLVKVFANLKSRMKTSGSLWLVLGDDYRNERRGVPAEVAKALVDDGWYLHRAYAWNKEDTTIVKVAGPLARSSRDYVMQFTQGRDYYLAKEPYSGPFESQVDGSTHYEGSDTLAFPMQLVRPLIEATVPIGGTVVDPFVGTGTTILAAVQARRQGLGIDLSSKELDIAWGRLGGGYTIMKSDYTGRDDLQKALRLADRGMYLWGMLLKAGDMEDVEDPDAGDEDDFLALPEVPAENSLPSKQKVFEALTQVAQMLGEVINDESLFTQMDPEEAQRLQAIKGWLESAGKPGQPAQSPNTGAGTDSMRQDPELRRRPGQGQERDPNRGRPDNRRGDTYQKYSSLNLRRAAQDINLSVKAVVQNPDGHLVLKDAYSDWWDLPGGHVEEGETLDNSLAREIKEETDLTLVKATMRGVHALKLGDSIRPVVVYDAMVKGRVRLSEEHTGYAWANKGELERDSFNLGVFKQFVAKGIDFITPGDGAVNRAGNGVNAAPARVMVDGGIEKQGPPGPPPRPGLQWKPETHRWVHGPETGRQSGQDFEGQDLPYGPQPGVENPYEHAPGGTPPEPYQVWQSNMRRWADVEGSVPKIAKHNGLGENETKVVQDTLTGVHGGGKRPAQAFKDAVKRHGEVGLDVAAHLNDFYDMGLKEEPGAGLKLPGAGVMGDQYKEAGYVRSLLNSDLRRLEEAARGQKIEDGLAKVVNGEVARREAQRAQSIKGLSVTKGKFGDPESALEAIRQEHPEVKFVETKPDGDQLAEDPITGDSWYVTQDGMVYEYWHPEGGKEDKAGFHAGPASVGFEPMS